MIRRWWISKRGGCGGLAQRKRQATDHKSSAINPQSATPTSSSDHSEGFSANSLPSLTTYALIAGTRCGPLPSRTLVIIGCAGCSAQVTYQLNRTDKYRSAHSPLDNNNACAALTKTQLRIFCVLLICRLRLVQFGVLKCLTCIQTMCPEGVGKS